MQRYHCWECILMIKIELNQLEKALQKSNLEYDKYLSVQKLMEKEQNLIEIEQDIMKLKGK